MNWTNKKCIYTVPCNQEKCSSPACAANKDDDGRQGLLDEICADYRVAVNSRHRDSIMDALSALRREILDFDGTEWTLAELEKAMLPIVTGSNWKRRAGQRKLTWPSMMASLREIRSQSANT